MRLGGIDLEGQVNLAGAIENGERDRLGRTRRRPADGTEAPPVVRNRPPIPPAELFSAGCPRSPKPPHGSGIASALR